MRRRDSLGSFASNSNHLGQIEAAFALESLFERFTFEQFHRQKDDVAVLAYLINGNYVIVLDGPSCLGLAQKSLFGGWVQGERRRERLQCHFTLQLRIVSPKNESHTAATQ